MKPVEGREIEPQTQSSAVRYGESLRDVARVDALKATGRERKACESRKRLLAR